MTKLADEDDFTHYYNATVRLTKENKRLLALVREVWDSSLGDIRRDPGPSEILAETGWYKRASAALGIVHEQKTLPENE